MSEKGKISIAVLVVFILAFIITQYVNEEKKLDTKNEIETKLLKDFQTHKNEFYTWTNFFLEQKDFPNEWYMANNGRGILHFTDESKHDNHFNLFIPETLPPNFKNKLDEYNIDDISFYNSVDSSETMIIYYFGKHYITSNNNRTLRLVYNPSSSIADTTLNKYNWTLRLEPMWYLESKTND